MKILITGAGSGIGHDAALELAKHGHDVLATTHTEADAEKMRTEAAREGLKIRSEKLDITLQSDVDRFKDEEIDVLINNAALGESGPVSEIPLDRFERLLDTNVVGTVRMTQAFKPQMVKRGKGRIIIVSSLAGRVVTPFLGPYNMTKFALEAAGDSLRIELEPSGVHVSLIEPGLIYTGFNERMAGSKYAWLKSDSVIAKYVEQMKKREARLPKVSSTTESVVAAIVHAVESARPKTRYIAPKSYGPSIFFLRFIPDRLKDRIMRSVGGI
jgi:short-subunit dehydrogenase